jgi:hypothetical protein
MQVLNLHEDQWSGRADYIGRGSVLGNPYVVGRDGARSQVIKQYHALLRQIVAAGRAGRYYRQPPVSEEYALECLRQRKVAEPEYRQAVWEALEKLRLRLFAGESLILLCYCRPLPCHGDVIARYLKWVCLQTPARHA